jgi:hypothetical protein
MIMIITCTKAEYEQIKKELADLEDQYNKLCKERDELLAEERRIQDEQMAEQEKIRHLHHSATVIQRWWREKLRKLQQEKRQLRSRNTTRKSVTRSIKPGTKSTRSTTQKSIQNKSPSRATSRQSNRATSPSKNSLGTGRSKTSAVS